MQGTEAGFDQFAAHLGQTSPERLTEVLQLRPDVLWAPLPRDLRDLAERLDDPTGLAGSVVALSTPGLQLLATIAAGGPAPRQRLLDLLGTTAEALDEHLSGLLGRALAWEADGVVRPAPSLHQVLQAPLGLGPSLETLLPELTTAPLEAALRGLGVPLPKPRNKASLAAALREALRDEERVLGQLAQAPPAVRSWLQRRLGTTGEDPYDPAAWRIAQQSLQWAQQHGLALPSYWGHLPVLPSEVGLALRPAGAPLPFAAETPEVVTHPVAPETVASASAAALAELLATTTALVDELHRGGAALLRSGGVGARELTRLSKALGTDVERVRLALELSDALGLLDDTDLERVRVSEEGRGWRDLEPAARAMSLLAAWLEMGSTPTAATEGGKTRPALSESGECGRCLLARHALLAALAALGPTDATSVPGVGARVAWRAPSAHSGAEDDGVPFARHWHEAELVGVVAAGALAPVGRLFMSGDVAAVGELLRQALPATVERVLFGADLTAVVPGDPSAPVTRLLDACADREGRGGAVVWRLSPGSVRRALDAGATGADLLRQLAEVAAGELPQPLRYLVDDVARGHGSLRVRPAVSLVRCDDAPLLAQVCADRALRKHGLALVAPTVASATAAPEVLLSALRAAGYLPMPEGPDGTVTLAAVGGTGAGGHNARQTARDERRRAFDELAELFNRIGGVPDDLAELEGLEGLKGLVDGDLDARGALNDGAVDLEELARTLLGGTKTQKPASTPTGPVGLTGAGRERLARLARRLPPAQYRLLAHAVSQQGSVEIDYETAAGSASTRVISDVRLVDDALFAWCQLTHDQRMFKVERVLAVRPIR